jgi:hypothetical protein
MRNRHAGFAHILILVGLAVFGALASVIGVRHFTLPEQRELQDVNWPPWPAVPEGLHRPAVIHAGDVSGQSAFRTVFVIGEVRSPGVISTDEELTLSRVLALAGGVKAGAGATAFVVRLDAPADTPTAPDAAGAHVFPLELDDARAPLEDGDTVYVRAAALVAVLGGVTNPGVYVFVPGMTVAEAVMKAGGVVTPASSDTFRVARFVNGRRKTVELRPDARLTPGDVVNVRGRAVR